MAIRAAISDTGLIQNLPLTILLFRWRRGAVVERRTCDSSLGRARGVKTLGKFLTPMCASVTKQYKLVLA